LVNAVACFSR